jgi:hypothetical protein
MLGSLLLYELQVGCIGLGLITFVSVCIHLFFFFLFYPPADANVLKFGYIGRQAEG